MKTEFSEEAIKALRILRNTDQNLLITGKAGTGKSTLLEYFVQTNTKKSVVLAPTGVAALNVNGETIHSFFGLKPGFELDEVIEKFHCKNPEKFQKLEMIIIDEISMVRADILDAMDIFLQKVRQDFRAFGGIQMVFIGDLYQLPPVVTPDDREVFYSRYKSPFFFSAKVIRGGSVDIRDNYNQSFFDHQNGFDFESNFELQHIELQKIYRQKDQNFIELLNAVRDKSINRDQLYKINSRVQKSIRPAKNCIHLTTTNKTANKINETKLSELLSEDYQFEADIEGEVQNNQHPTETKLKLKIGAQVMFVNNHQHRQWVNGTIGKIVDIDPIMELIIVETNEGKRVEVERQTWEISRYVMKDGKFDREIIGSFKQIPMKLAWAITIHKSQGKTFDNAIVDLGFGSFAHGQTYVALSRCRTIEGLFLKRPIRPSDIKMDSKVKYFLEYLKKKNRV